MHVRPEDTWARLRQIGIPASAEVRRMAQRLREAHHTMKQLRVAIHAMERRGEWGEPEAVTLMQRFVQGEQEHADCLNQLSDWLTGKERSADPVPEGV